MIENVVDPLEGEYRAKTIHLLADRYKLKLAPLSYTDPRCTEKATYSYRGNAHCK